MEEDIKILEEFKTNGYSMLLMRYGDRNKTNLKLERALENILKENENLKQAIAINKNLYQDVCNKNKELEKRDKEIRELKEKKDKMLDEIIISLIKYFRALKEVESK